VAPRDRENSVTMNGRLSRFGSAAKQRAVRAWRAPVAQAEHAGQWLMARRRMVFWAVGIGVAVAVLIGFLSSGGPVWFWTRYSPHYRAISPLVTLLAGLAVAWVALLRHFAQTQADRQRHITESYSKAIEQLGSGQIEVRLGGIYSLERISRESLDDYWTIIETLTAFVRERSRHTEAERIERVSQRAYFLWLEAGRPEGRADFFWAKALEGGEFRERSPMDIAAVLTVVRRRSERGRKREIANDWHLDLTDAILKRATLCGWHLERFYLDGAHLEHADLRKAHLEGANLFGARLERASLVEANLEGAKLYGAHLEGARLNASNLKRADFQFAHLEGADLRHGLQSKQTDLEGTNLDNAHLDNARLERADLREAVGLSESQLMKAFGNASTRLPEGIARPSHWPNTTW
jgi:uncharacterized protein YjbI with pentapeptide repeats